MSGNDAFAHIRQLPVTEQLAYFAARYIWSMRDELAPIPVPDDDGVRNQITWRQWWQKKFSLNLDDFVAQHMKG